MYALKYVVSGKSMTKPQNHKAPNFPIHRTHSNFEAETKIQSTNTNTHVRKDGKMQTYGKNENLRFWTPKSGRNSEYSNHVCETRA